jgi:hypothetical protein
VEYDVALQWSHARKNIPHSSFNATKLLGPQFGDPAALVVGMVGVKHACFYFSFHHSERLSFAWAAFCTFGLPFHRFSAGFHAIFFGNLDSGTWKFSFIR